MNLKPLQVQQLQAELQEQQETLRVLSELTQMSVTMAQELLQCNVNDAQEQQAPIITSDHSSFKSQQADKVPAEIVAWSKLFTRKCQALLQVEGHREQRRQSGISSSYLPVLKIGVSSPDE